MALIASQQSPYADKIKSVTFSEAKDNGESSKSKRYASPNTVLVSFHMSMHTYS